MMGNFQVTECLRAGSALLKTPQPQTAAPHGVPVHMEAPGKGLDPQSENIFLWIPLTAGHRKTENSRQENAEQW